MKKFLILLLTVVLGIGVFTVTAMADTVVTDDNGFTYTMKDGESTWTITGYSGSATNLTVPASYNGKKVTAIGTYAFGRNNTLKTVKISEGIKTVGAKAFQNCYNVKSLTLPSTLTTIGDYAFDGICTSTVNNSNPNMKVTIPANVTSIGKYAFAHNTGMTGVEFSSGITTIGSFAFAQSGITVAKLPSSVTSIGSYAFSVCSNLVAINIPSGCTVGANAFMNSSSVRIFGFSGSSAQTYANNNGCNFTIFKGNLTKVQNLKAGIKLTWTKRAGVTGYKIYRSVSGGDYSLLTTISSASTVTYTDTSTSNGKKYQYKVLPYKTVSGVTLYGSKSSALTIYRLTMPTISSVSNSAAGAITVKWNTNSSATGYQIKYIVGSTTKTVKVSGASTASKKITGLTKNKTYKVYVRSYKTVSGTTYYSKYSAVKSITLSK